MPGCLMEKRSLAKQVSTSYFRIFRFFEVCAHRFNGVCVCSNSGNDVPQVAQRYETIATHTRRHASVLVVFVLFSVHMHSLPV